MIFDNAAAFSNAAQTISDADVDGKPSQVALHRIRLRGTRRPERDVTGHLRQDEIAKAVSVSHVEAANYVPHGKLAAGAAAQMA